MSTPQFDAHFVEYIAEAKQARDQNQHHDNRRHIFMGFLHNAFNIDTNDVNIEQYIQIANKQVPTRGGLARVRKGWIDAVFHDLIFEFKRDLKKEEAEGLRELHDYLSNLQNGAECVGLLTDGLIFVAYVLDEEQPNGLRLIDSINAETAVPSAAYLWFDAYLLRQNNVPPTSADIVRRFGLNSPTFVSVARILRNTLKVFGAREAGALEVKRQQWAFHLARVYGTADVTNDEMFIRHTYLCQFAKILAYVARFGIEKATQEIEGVISGKAFEVLGFNNIGEQDFFAWVLAPEVRSETLNVFSHIAASLIVYNFATINEDLLKQLYQNLVEAETRHELGEFYTPDWLAELTLREIGYGPGKSLLDPSCGSGTFLFTAIRLLIQQGVTGQTLIDFALENIMGMDVHPLAVTIAKLNYMLALLPHMQAVRGRSLRMIPISMANALQAPSTSERIEVIQVPIDNEREFRIPIGAAHYPHELTELLYEMGRFAEHAVSIASDKIKFGEFGDYALSKIPSISKDAQDEQIERITWTTNARQLIKQIVDGRNSIWVYVLQNTSRPLILRYRKFDIVIGNPPWISYRYIKDASYQNEIKKLIREYKLLATNDIKLNTQMELATLFFEHCHFSYLKEHGTIAFVMPRSVITGAKQHQVFQQRGFSSILDLKGVKPLFGVESCVMISEPGKLRTSAIPTLDIIGRLPAQECTLAVAGAKLTMTPTSTTFATQADIGSPYYYARFKQGATLVPRNLTFVASAQPGLAPGQAAHIPIMRTDPEANEEAKVPWKGLSLQGHIDDDFLYATLLSKHLVPFGIRKLHLVALPMRVGIPEQIVAVPGQVREERFIPMSLDEIGDSITLIGSANEWFGPGEKLWMQFRKSTTMSLWDRVNYQQGVTMQTAVPGYLVLYGATGSNLASVVIDTHDLPIIQGAQPKAFVVDHKTYWYRCTTMDEAYFLSAILNAPFVDYAIKVHQTRGLFGARDIHRRPFEVCAIPQFDPANADHQRLAALGQEAHVVVASLPHSSSSGVVAGRKQARQAAHVYIEQIDTLVQHILGDGPPTLAPQVHERKKDYQSSLDQMSFEQ